MRSPIPTGLRNTSAREGYKFLYQCGDKRGSNRFPSAPTAREAGAPSQICDARVVGKSMMMMKTALSDYSTTAIKGSVGDVAALISPTKVQQWLVLLGCSCARNLVPVHYCYCMILVLRGAVRDAAVICRRSIFPKRFLIPCLADSRSNRCIGFVAGWVALSHANAFTACLAFRSSMCRHKRKPLIPGSNVAIWALGKLKLLLAGLGEADQ